MSEKQEKKGEPAPAAAAASEKKAGGGLLAKTPVLLGGAMLIEAVVLFAGFKFLGGGSPHAAAGAEISSEKAEGGADGHGGVSTDKNKLVEVPVLDFRCPNKLTGRTYLYDVSIVTVIKQDNVEKAKAAFDERKALIQDRIRTIIAQTDPEKLGGGSEPGLDTLRRQVKYQLDLILGDGVVDSVLVPKCIPFRTDY